MKQITMLALCGLAATALFASPAAAQTQSYRVEANSTDNITLTLCNPRVQVEVHGDGDTDLDFTITDPSGAVLHSDVDDTDWTIATIDNGDGACREYNLQVENYGDVYNQFSVALTNVEATSGASSDDGFDRHIRVHNHTGETIYYIYWSNTGDDSWREDRLGEDVLMDGDEWSVNIDDGSGACRFDLKAVTANEREIIRNNVNVCTESFVDFN